jgi:NitT/TauT family transport system substrate-binding protein
MELKGTFMKKNHNATNWNLLWVLLIGLVFLPGRAWGEADRELPTVKIAYLPITHALPLYVTQELHREKFKNFNLELVKFGSWPELMDALNAGRVDGASVLIELAIKAKEKGIDIRAVALGHRDGNVVVVANDIKGLADLKGKIFAIPHRMSSHNILLHLLLAKAKLSVKDLTVLELPPPEMPAALASGRIAGYIVAEPFGAKSVAGGKGKVLFKSGELWPNALCCGLVLRNEFLRDHRPAARELVADYIRSGLYIDNHGEKVHDISRKYMKVDPKVLKLSLKWISYKDLKITEGDYRDLIRYMIELNLIKKPPLYAEFVDNTLFDAAKEKK